MSEPKLNIKEETSTKKTRSPPKKAKVEQTVPKKKKGSMIIRELIRLIMRTFQVQSICSEELP